jgi:hypothetical protein
MFTGRLPATLHDLLAEGVAKGVPMLRCTIAGNSSRCTLVCVVVLRGAARLATPQLAAQRFRAGLPAGLEPCATNRRSCHHKKWIELIIGAAKREAGAGAACGSCRMVSEHVTDSSNRVNERSRKTAIDLVPQRIDVHFDDVADAVEVNVPDVLDDQ